jgi:hypothetical protein
MLKNGQFLKIRPTAGESVAFVLCELDVSVVTYIYSMHLSEQAMKLWMLFELTINHLQNVAHHRREHPPSLPEGVEHGAHHLFRE